MHKQNIQKAANKSGKASGNGSQRSGNHIDGHEAQSAENILQNKNLNSELHQLKTLQKIVDNSLQVRKGKEWQSIANQTSLKGNRMKSSSQMPLTTLQMVSKDTLDLWNKENNQTIALDSGNAGTEKDSVEFNDGDIKIMVSEFAYNHFSNRHTIKQYSFKDSNIKRVNSFWAAGTSEDDVLENATSVIAGLEDEITDNIGKGGGAVNEKNNTVNGLTVGYKIGTEVSEEDDAYDDGTGLYTKGKGQMEMFYPEGDGYTYYSEEELKGIRGDLQKPPYSKALQLKKAPVNSQVSAPLQLMSISEAEKILKEPFGEKIFDEFKTVITKETDTADIPDYLVDKVKDLPQYYLPTTKDMWPGFIEKVMKYNDKPLTEDNIPEVSYEKEEVSAEVAEGRERILDSIGGKSEADARGKISEKYKPLIDKIDQGDLTFNFAIDMLFNFKEPSLLNGFEIEDKLKHSSPNISGELKGERLDAENTHFELPKEAIKPSLRPKYGAINFKGHDFGAAPRNDYGMSYMVLNKEVKNSTTLTLGDSFNMEGGPYLATKIGVQALVHKISEGMGAYDKMLDESLYNPGETYIEAQIHQDIDIRKDVSEIVISTAELALFNVDIKLVDKLISNLTQGLFIRVI